MEEALVIKRKELFNGKEFQGFLPLEERNIIQTILDKHYYHPRGGELENNKELQQIIPYVWIINPQTKSAFLYKRELNKKQNGEYEEKRYLKNFSGGVGGHINKDTESKTKDPIINAMMRELKEEIRTEYYPAPKLLGYINDDSNSLGSVHFGILAVTETTKKVECKKSEGLKSGNFYSIKEIDEIILNPKHQVESWTKISWPYIKEYLKNY